MGYTALWGPKGFIVSANKIVPITGLSTSLRLKKDSENDTSGTPTTNTRGVELQALTLETKYLAAAGVNPRMQIEEWKNELGNSYPLIIGGERFGPEKLQLTGIDVSDVMLSPDGRMLSVTIGLTFLEYSETTGSKLDSSKTAAGSSNTAQNKAIALKTTASASDKAQKQPKAGTRTRMGVV